LQLQQPQRLLLLVIIQHLYSMGYLHHRHRLITDKLTENRKEHVFFCLIFVLVCIYVYYWCFILLCRLKFQKKIYYILWWMNYFHFVLLEIIDFLTEQNNENGRVRSFLLFFWIFIIWLRTRIC
jgi:hypothetical protein